MCTALGFAWECVWKSGKWKWREREMEWERGRKNLMHHEHGFYSSMDIWQRFRFETCKQNCTFPSPEEFSITWIMWFYKQLEQYRSGRLFMYFCVCVFTYRYKNLQKYMWQVLKRGERSLPSFLNIYFIYGISVQKPASYLLTSRNLN